MNQSLKNIALIHHKVFPYDLHKVKVLVDNFRYADVQCQVYHDTDSFVQSGFVPDCLIIMDAVEGKMTPYPTYGLLDSQLHHVFSTDRFVRNILTYDAYLSLSEFTHAAIGDLLFSARKLGSPVGYFSASPKGQTDSAESHMDFRHAYPVSVVKNKVSKIEKLAAELGVVKIHHYAGAKRNNRFNSIKDLSETASANLYRQAAIGVDFFGCDDLNKVLSFKLMEIIASGALAITNESDYLYEIFGDSLLYIPYDAGCKTCLKRIKRYAQWARNNPDQAAEKAKRAQSIYQEKFGPKILLGNLERLHAQTLHDKGYIAPKVSKEDGPTVSYIMRTGGDPKWIRRTLDSLAAQNYPHIQVLLVLYKPLKDMSILIKDYEKTLKFKVVEDFGGLRSTGIVTGMKNVDTDYFGLMDDDDILHSNHIYTLLKTLEYHNQRMDFRGKIRLAYAGSYIFSDNMKFGERREWWDQYLGQDHKYRIVENFRFYETEQMVNHVWYMMSNAWLAHHSLINDEVLRDPKTHSHEDIYFELQFATQTHFAFSCEMTSGHWFHGGNSTVVDRYRNDYDNFRHMTSLMFRPFPRAKHYRTDKHPLHVNITHLPVPWGSFPVYLNDKIPRKLLWKKRLKSFEKKGIRPVLHWFKRSFGR
jgi:glycosyltransferase involved in cell wall biosynthesis